MQDRLPPHDIDAEEAVIGSLLIDGSTISQVRGFLKPEDFYSERMSQMFSACLELDAINQITLAEALDRKGNLEACGGASYLSHLISIVPTTLDIEHYAEIVSRYSISRQLIQASDQIATTGYKAEPRVSDMLQRASDTIDSVRRKATLFDTTVKTPKDMANSLMALIEDFKHDSLAMRWGFRDLDRLTTGIYRKEYTVIGGRPSLGKTQIMLDTADNLALEDKKGLIASLEMSENQILERQIAKNMSVSIADIRKRTLSDDQWGNIADLAGEISEVPIYYLFNDLTSQEIAMWATRVKEQYGLDYLMVDYIQMCKDCRGVQNAHQALSSASKVFKSLAKSLDIAVIIASQLNREVEKRFNKRPMLSDLRESGSLEEDSDVAFLLYRDEYYYKSELDWEEARQQRIVRDEPYPKGVLEVYMAKSRQLGGGYPEVKLQWHPGKHCYVDKAYVGLGQ